MTKLVSVIIPNYKRIDKLERSINSVLNQTYTNYEIIVVDDNSPNINEIEKMIKQFESTKIKFIKSIVNKGGGGARNIGINNAQGEFISFLDSDDEWLKNKLEKQISYYLDNIKDSNCILFSKILMDRGYEKTIFPKNYIPDNIRDIAKYIFIENGLVHTNVLFMPTKIAKNIMFDDKLRKHQDYDFVLRAAKEGVTFQMINETLAVWYNGRSGDRMGNNHSYQISIEWFENNKDILGDKRIQNAFIKRDVVHQISSNKFSIKSLLKLLELYNKGYIDFFQLFKSSLIVFIINPKKFLN